MSSVLPLAAGIVAASERSLLTLGRAADKNSSGAVFAVRPPLETQDAEPDFPRSADAVVIPIEVVQEITAEAATAPQDAAAAYSAVAAAVGQLDQAAQTAPNVNAMAEAVPPPLAANVVASSQAAYAYAQMMQGWMETKPPRPAAQRRPSRPKASPKR
jgi:hypothetical protein